MPVIEEITIASLVPYESGVVHSTVQKKMAALQKGKQLPPVKVVMVDSVPMVRDGNNSVVAHKQLHYETVPCVVDILPQCDYPSFRDTLALRRKKGQVGFENFPVLLSSGERAALTIQEQKEMIEGDSLATLSAALGKKAGRK